MRTDLINLNNIPNSNELILLLGKELYECYLKICKNIVLSLSPDIERWANGGRRGKYYHGYIMDKKAISIDLFFISDVEFKELICDFHFPKKMFARVFKQKQLFSKVGQEAIDSCVRLHEEYPYGFTLELRLNNDKSIFSDVMRIINVIGNK
ncbi:DUF3788 family protein [Bacteroides ovatus]|uniref:DUF3788 family protein n=1 Tax=Bacteroides ovatus TaxID=28116 RepID=UPI00189D898B|nr:DUF3788 family protein [Bacteroides ovatus]MDC2664879.1 DUF3788 family protein [Bacteroides ovatus]